MKYSIQKWREARRQKKLDARLNARVSAAFPRLASDPDMIQLVKEVSLLFWHGQTLAEYLAEPPVSEKEMQKAHEKYGYGEGHTIQINRKVKL